MPKVFLLTGSSRGLGRQIAEAALAAGHRLVATARRPESLADLAGRYGRQILPVALDVTDPPLRLILGSEAYAYATAAARARAEADAAWHDLTISTDRDDASAADRDPLGTSSS